MEVLGGAACHTQYSYSVHCSNVTANCRNSKKGRAGKLSGNWQKSRAFHFCFSKLVMNDGHSCLVTFIK